MGACAGGTAHLIYAKLYAQSPVLYKPDMVAPVCNPSTEEVGPDKQNFKAIFSLGQFEFETSFGYMRTLLLPT